MAIGDHHVSLTGGQTRERRAVRVGLHHVIQIGNGLAIVLLQPEARVDVAGCGRRGEHGPGRAVEIVPRQLLAGVDLLEQRLTLGARTGQNDRAVVGRHVLCVFLDGAVVPVGGVVGVLVDAVAQRRQQHVAVIGKQDIVAAGDEADVRAAGAERLAHGGVARTDGHVDVLHVIALFEELRLEQRLKRLGRCRDLVGVRIRRERDLQALDRLCAAAAAAVLLAAAGHQTERHDQRQHHCHYFFHVHTLQINSFSRPRA